VETISFLAWKDEAYQLGMDWAHCHPAETPSRGLIENMMEKWYLVNIGMFFPWFKFGIVIKLTELTLGSSQRLSSDSCSLSIV